MYHFAALLKNGGWTPLHTACYGGRDAVVAILLRHDAVDIGRHIHGRRTLPVAGATDIATGTMAAKGHLNGRY